MASSSLSALRRSSEAGKDLAASDQKQHTLLDFHPRVSLNAFKNAVSMAVSGVRQTRRVSAMGPNVSDVPIEVIAGRRIRCILYTRHPTFLPLEQRYGCLRRMAFARPRCSIQAAAMACLPGLSGMPPMHPRSAPHSPQDLHGLKGPNLEDQRLARTPVTDRSSFIFTSRCISPITRPISRSTGRAAHWRSRSGTRRSACR